MRDDRFDQRPGFTRLLFPKENALKGVTSPQELQAFKERRPSRKIVEAKQVLRLVKGETDPELAGIPSEGYFVELARAVPVVSGRGADYFDPEETITLVG